MIPSLYQLSYQGLDGYGSGLKVEIGEEIRILAFGREMDPGHRHAGIFNFMLDLVSDIEFDGLVDLIPKLSSTLL